MYAHVLKGCKPKAKAKVDETKKADASWFGGVSKGLIGSLAGRVAASAGVPKDGRKTIPTPPPKAEAPAPAAGRKTIMPIIGSRKEEGGYAAVLKTSEGAKKAWLTRSRTKSSGSPTLDAIRASAKNDQAARAQFRAMQAKSKKHDQFSSDLGLLP